VAARLRKQSDAANANQQFLAQRPQRHYSWTMRFSPTLGSVIGGQDIMSTVLVKRYAGDAKSFTLLVCAGIHVYPVW
jgi:hypothetical protein